MSKPDMDALVNLIVDSGMAEMDKLSGFPDEDIKALEKKHNVRLPGAYKEFLSSIGYSAPDIFNSVLIMYPGLDKYRDNAYELAKENNIKIPADAFVFLIEDSQFFYFDTKSGDDPAVFKYFEGDKEAKQVFDHFSDWLTDFITVEAELETEYSSTK